MRAILTIHYAEDKITHTIKSIPWEHVEEIYLRYHYDEDPDVEVKYTPDEVFISTSNETYIVSVAHYDMLMQAWTNDTPLTIQDESEWEVENYDEEDEDDDDIDDDDIEFLKGEEDK